MRGGKEAAKKIRTNTKEYSDAADADAVFLLGNTETRWYSSSRKAAKEKEAAKELRIR